jgi:predicted transcriptional regulator
MVAITRSQNLDLADGLPSEARAAIRSLLESEPKATRKVYAALARKVWSLLIERRFDDEIRDWHDLIRGVKARISETDDAAAERLTALGDLLRESISLAQTSPARDVANRPRARGILGFLDKAEAYVPRRKLLAELEIGSSHLSNVLTQLVAHNLVDRRGVGKEAEFRITNLGRQLIGVDVVRSEDVPGRASKTEAFSSRLKNIDAELLIDLQGKTLLSAARKSGPLVIDFLTETHLYGVGLVQEGASRSETHDIPIPGRSHFNRLGRQGSLSSVPSNVKRTSVAIAKSY